MVGPFYDEIKACIYKRGHNTNWENKIKRCTWMTLVWPELAFDYQWEERI